MTEYHQPYESVDTSLNLIVLGKEEDATDFSILDF